MEWIRISANKLKIMLTAEDALHYDLDCKEPNYADMMAHAAFREMLTDVRRETGFDATDDKTYIQMYPSKEGGCELFITKIGLVVSEEREECKMPIVPCKKEHPRPQQGRVGSCERVFVFERLELLLASCRALLCVESIEESVAWQDDRARWWLSLLSCEERTRGFLSLLLDFGKEVSDESARAFLCEHARPICRTRAVETLGKL